MRRFSLVAVLLVGAPLLAGCGLPDDDRPRLIADADAPIDLSPTTAPTDTTPEDADNRVDVFFVDAGAGIPTLQSVRRPVEEDTVDEAIRVLLLGVAEGDPDGLRTSIPTGTQLRGPTVLENDVLTIDLTPTEVEGSIESLVGDFQIQAVAELVRTATAHPGIARVRFLVDGVPIPVLTGSGQVTQEPVGRGDYGQLAPG